MRIAVRFLFFFTLGFMLVNCSGKNPQEYYDSGLSNIKDGKYEEALKDFETLIKEDPKNNLAVNAYFEMGKIFHGKLIKTFSSIESSEQAVEYYKVVADNYPDSPLAPNALFMVGFIQANELENLDAARDSYNKFLTKYPNSELAKSAEAELENLGIPAEEILMKKLKDQ